LQHQRASALPLFGRAGERLQLRCTSGAVRGQKTYSNNDFKIISKIKKEKNFKKEDFLILFLK
jgi:hypothetical protein